MLWLLLGLLAQPVLGDSAPTRKVLFLCTGNFFRSVFAEHYFNALSARNQQLDPRDPQRKPVLWLAESRGLDTAQLSPSQKAARMSAFTIARLKRLKVPIPVDAATRLPAHAPTLLTLADLKHCDRIIALHDASHRPMLRAFLQRHQARAQDRDALLDSVVYWNIEDVVAAPVIPLTPEQQAKRALDEVQKAVDQLFAGL